MTTRQRMTHFINHETGVLATVAARYNEDGEFVKVRVTVTDIDCGEVVGVKFYPTTMQEEAIAYAEQCAA